MTAHALACGLCSSNPQSGTAWFASAAGLLIFGLFLICAGSREQRRRRAGLPPREPATDMSPFMASLLSGASRPAYTSRFRAVTPRGVTVTGKCCQRGHQSPSQAVAHAQQVAWRIAATGR